jgi:DNA-binding NarL/FixJ family response regulator
MHLLERDDALDAARQVLSSARSGRGAALFLVAEAGLGKTTVLEHAVKQAGDAFQIGVGRGDVVEATLPFGVLEQALDPLLMEERAHAGLFESAGDASPAARFWTVLRRLREVAVRPLLVALDDLQWADSDSLALLHLLCRRLPALPIALVGTARPWPGAAMQMIEDLQASHLAAVARLAPLRPAAAATLFREHARATVSEAEIEHALDLSGGNPLLLILLAQGRVSEPPIRVGKPVAAHPPFLLARFLGIGHEERRYMRAASVLGTRFRTAVAAEIADDGPLLADDVLDNLFETGLLRESGDEWAEFTHALIRQAIYEELPAAVRVLLHRRAFRALLRRGVSAAEAAEHAISAHLRHDDAAIHALQRAGDTARQSGAVRTARRYLEAAIELAGESPASELLLALADVLLSDGASEAAIRIDERLLQSTSVSEPTRARALGQLGRAAFMNGALKRAGSAFDASAEVSTADRGLAVSALLDYAFWTWACLGPRAATPVTTRARELATGATPALQACADAAWGLCAYGSGEPLGLTVARAAAQRTELISHSATTASIHWALEPSGVPGDVAVWAEQFDEAEPLFDDLLRSAERWGNPFALFHAAFSWTDGLCRLGRLAEALALSERLFEVAEVAPMVSAFATAARALVLLEQGRLRDAEPWCDQLTRLANGQRWFLVVGYDLHRRGTLAFRKGEMEMACSAFDQLGRLSRQWGLLDPATIPWAADAISAYLACDRAADAQRVVDWLAPRAAVLPARWPRVVEARGRAALAQLAGDLDRAEQHYMRAVALQEDMSLPLTRAETLTQCGAFLVRRGDSARARGLLGEALQLAEQHGAEWHAARARAEWRRAGGRARRTPPGELTPQETAVAGLAQAGRTNGEIARRLLLSQHTVETHLAHVYRKLGIRRRWELIARTRSL